MRARPCRRSSHRRGRPREVAAQVNALGRFDAVIHNAAVGYQEGHRETADALPHVFAVNTLAAYVLTALMGEPDKRPDRLVYLSSGMHRGADAHLDPQVQDAALQDRLAALCEELSGIVLPP